jgi:hypothetical protein
MRNIGIGLGSLTLILALGACGTDDGPGAPSGGIPLQDNVGSGKYDVIAGRTVLPEITETVYLDGNEYEGNFTVSDVTDESLVVTGPMIAFAPQSDGLQATVTSSFFTVRRFLLMYRADPMQEWSPITLDASAIYERESSETGEQMDVDLTISYFQTVSLRMFEREITFSSDEVVGQVTAALPVDNPTEVEFGVFVITVDSTWFDLEGEYDMRVTASCNGDVCTPPGDTPVEPPMPADIYADARNPDLAEVVIMGAAPESYDRPDYVNDMSLGGTEFWQQWPEGHSPTFSFSEGTDQGRTCMQASAIRWETIMADPPPSIVGVLNTTNWSGSWFNWNDDYTESSSGDASGARLWAWRTGLIKWISQTGQDGTCYLPTREMVERLADSCGSRAETSDGEIQGCSAR